jgi:hypothetical protein
MLVVKLDQSVLDFILRGRTHRMQPQQPNCAIIVRAGDELVVAGVVLGLGEDIVVVIVTPDRDVAPPNIPEFD